MELIGFACSCLVMWQSLGLTAIAAQSTFGDCVAEFDARARQLETAREPEARGRATLEWLRALQAVLAAVPIEKVEKPELEWLDNHENLVVYSEPAGAWLIQDTIIWEAHEKNKATSAADEIAWLAVVNGLPGECEGYVPCYASGLHRLEGEYLRRHPQGRHRREALANVDEMLTIVLDDLLKRPDAADFFKVPADCGDALKGLRPLRQAVATGTDEQTTNTLRLLDRLIAYCPN